MTNSARLSGRPSSSAAYNVGDVVDTPDSAIKSWRYLGAGEWEPNDAVRYTTSPDGGFEFPADVQEAIIAIAGDASSGTAQIVDGYPVEVTGTSETVVSSVPCDVVWIAHNGAAGTITLRDAATTGSGLAAAKTVDMATEPTMQAGALRTQYGVSAVLTAGKATFWVRPM